MAIKNKTTESPLTLKQLMEYHEKFVEHRFDKLEKNLQEFRHETQQRFDDLYKKFEAL